jgi:penicillin-binding protein 1A
MFEKRWHVVVAAIGAALFGAVAVAALASALIYPNLPDLSALTDYRPKVPLRIFTVEGALLGEFGEERRVVVKIRDVPEHMRQAIVSAEDERFYRHKGIDTLGVLRAASANLLSGGVKEGASTITMQVARNFFLSSERTFTRKLNEALLAIKIEHNLSKDQILELYLNHIYLGQRAYGFGAAALTYFGKPLGQVSVAEAAMLAGLPKAPSRYNPVVNPTRAAERQRYVLRRMLELKHIDQARYDAALAEKLKVRQEKVFTDVTGDFVAEMVRQELVAKYGEQVYSSGWRVYTTIRRDQQQAAVAALTAGVLDYDARHGYRGPEKNVQLPRDDPTAQAPIEDALHDLSAVRGLQPAVVLSANERRVVAQVKGGEQVKVTGAGLAFAQRALSSMAASSKATKPIRRGSIIRLLKDPKLGWRIAQLPQVEAALVAMDPRDGAITALVGGFDFTRNKFNHVTQAWRQPGSSFKPFIYSASLERGFSPSTMLEDTPLTLSAEEAGGQVWEPRNYDGEYLGTVSMRRALYKSLNLASVRLLEAIGPLYARDFAAKFGFDTRRQPPYLTLALGAGEVTPLQMAVAYGVFAQGGQRVEPYFIGRILDGEGRQQHRAAPAAPRRVLDPRNAFLMSHMLQDVIRHGTGFAASRLQRWDLAGKTGTTNDQRDAWFTGYHPHLVAVSWMGFDQPRSMGGGETGAQAALPIWTRFMEQALRKLPETPLPVPDGIVSLSVDAATGLPVAEGGAGVLEFFYEENLPGDAGLPPLDAPPDAGAPASAPDVTG